MTAIQDKYNSLPINLGAALSEEESLPDGGTKQHFEFGSIYFHPSVGEAFECHGLILQTYMQLGEEQSDLGYPVTDEMDNPATEGGRMNRFEFGRLFWEFTHGVTLELDEELSLAPEVVIKLHDDVLVSLGQGERLSLDGIEAIVGNNPFIDGLRILLPDLLFRRVFDSVSPQGIQDLVDQALSHDPNYSPPNFESFLAIDCPIGFDAEQLLAVLNLGIGVVEYAYTVPQASDPNVVGATNPLFSQQTYLSSSTTHVSINAKTAWAMDADGAGLSFVDIERGWLLSHVDLPFGIPKLDGIIRKESRPHGSAVLGIVVGVDNDQGIVGIAPKADAIVISYYHPQYRLPDMIMFANEKMREGDVLLLEAELVMQVQAVEVSVPVEAADPAAFEAIRLATKKGLIVVEAAGNGGIDLDGLNDAGRPILPRDPSHDSGAILVGACHADLPYRRWTTPVTFGPSFGSNFGSRIDCSCIGEFIVAAGSKRDGGNTTLYSTGPHYFKDFFGGTSGASAIIAGVCLLIQDLQSKLSPLSGIIGPLGPLRMRNMLSNPQNGIASPPSDKIGVMPDFQKIIANEYNIPIL